MFEFQRSDVINYLTLLDNENEKFIWQLLPEREGTETPASSFCATLDKAYTRLCKANESGMSVYCTVNASSTHRRKLADICRVRACFVELDRCDISESDLDFLIQKYNVSFAVWSSIGKCHLYWRMAEGVVPLDKFSKLQAILQYIFREYEAGKESKDLPRVLRVPGFYHQKGEPFLSKLVIGNQMVWEDINEFMDMMGIDDTIIAEAKSADYFPMDAFHKLQVNPAVQGTEFIGTDSGNRNDCLFNYCYQVLFSTRGLNLEEGLALAHLHNSKNNPLLPDREVLSIVKSAFARYVEQGGVSLVDNRVAVEEAIRLGTNIENSQGEFIQVDANGDIVTIPTAPDYDYALHEMYPPNSQLSIASRVEQRFHTMIKYNRERGYYANRNGVWTNTRNVQGVVESYITYVTNQLDAEPQFRNCFVNNQMVFQPSAMNNYIRDIHSSRGLNAIRSLVCTREKIYEPHDNFETHADAHLIACKNGVLNMLTGEFETPKNIEKSRLVYRLGVEFKKDAECNLWKKFLLDCMAGEKESVDYIQKVCGYLLSGDTNLQSMFLVYGIPGTGKSLFLNVLSKLMGEYATELPPSVFLDKGQDNMSLSMLAQAQYCRMATVMEVDGKDKWGKSIIKALTGEDFVSVKLMRQDGFKYKPRFKLCIRANEMPHTDSLDQAIWERLKFLPFNVKFRGTEKDDVTLKDKLFEELSGILKWCAEGYAKLINEGIVCPEGITLSSLRIRRDTNPIDDFLNECLIREEGNMLRTKDLYESYEHWSRLNDFKPISKRRMEKYLLDKDMIASTPLSTKKCLVGWNTKEEFRVIGGNAIFNMI